MLAAGAAGVVGAGVISWATASDAARATTATRREERATENIMFKGDVQEGVVIERSEGILRETRRALEGRVGGREKTVDDDEERRNGFLGSSSVAEETNKAQKCWHPSPSPPWA